MALISLFSLILATSLLAECRSQCFEVPPPIRSCPVPVTVVESPNSPQTCNSNKEDLSTLLILTKLLDNDRSNYCCPCPNNCGIDVENIITKLINALVYTTTISARSQEAQNNRDRNSGRGSDYGGRPPNRGDAGGQQNNNDSSGLLVDVADVLNLGLEIGGQSQDVQSEGQGNNLLGLTNVLSNNFVSQ